MANLDRDAMLAIFAERGGDPDRPGKDDPLDCLVWQSARPDEPAWDTPLGHGRPGWHIECAAIALDHLGMTIDVQGGGTDLAFPHHEMSASEAQVLRQEHPFARHYVHSAMVGWQGHKMSKSRGNLVFVSALRHAGTDPNAIRLALLAHHYRADWSWTEQGLEGAERRLALWRSAVAAAADLTRRPSSRRCAPPSPTTCGRPTPSTRSTTGRWPCRRARATTPRRLRSSATSPTRCSACACSPESDEAVRPPA